MTGYKRIKQMIENNKLSDVSFDELKNYLETVGFKLEEGSKHVKVMTQDNRYLSGITRQKIIRPDQLRYILKQCGRI